MKRKNIALVLGLSILSIIFVAATPLARNIGGIIIYSIIGVPEQKNAKLSLAPAGSRLVSVGDTFTFKVVASSDVPINLVAANILFPKEAIGDIEFSTENSLLNLWIRGPAVSAESGSIEFGGGVQSDAGGFRGEGTVLTVTGKIKQSGSLALTFSKATVLAHDGKGTDIVGAREGLTYIARERGLPSPDFNADERVTFADVSIFLRNLGGVYNSRFDLNNDGRVNLTDLNKLLSLSISS